MQSLQKEDDLTNGFKWLMAHEKDIKVHYTNMMPEYIGKVYQIQTILGMSKRER